MVEDWHHLMARSRTSVAISAAYVSIAHGGGGGGRDGVWHPHQRRVEDIQRTEPVTQFNFSTAEEGAGGDHATISAWYNAPRSPD